MVLLHMTFPPCHKHKKNRPKTLHNSLLHAQNVQIDEKF